MSISPTRRRLERKRGRIMLALGVVEIIGGILWGRLADLDLAEGKKLTGVLSAIVSAMCLLTGVNNIRDSK